jgi:hypothetical protein
MATQYLNVIRGSDREFSIRIAIKESGEPFDLTGVTQILAYFPKEDGSALVKNMVSSGDIAVLSPTTGKIRVYLSETDTASLSVGEVQSFEIEVQIGGVTSIVQFVETLNVIDRVFGI